VEFLFQDSQTEKLLKHDANVAEAELMCYMLVHGPTLQAVKVLIQPQVPLWGEGVPAFQAFVD
jgi:hypothetical protein